MKIKLVLLIFSFPFVLMSQNKGDFRLAIDYGQIIDEKHTVHDVDDFSSDLYSRNNDEFKKSPRFSFAYSVNDSLLIGISYMKSNICGSNDIEYWNGEFDDLSLFSNFKIYTISNSTIYIKYGIGLINYNASRNLLSDNSKIPINSPNGNNILKHQYAIGTSFIFFNRLKLNFEISRNNVNDDGFDGWDYGSGVDRYIYRSIGLSYLISNLFGE